jgi:hypothetical protein
LERPFFEDKSVNEMTISALPLQNNQTFASSELRTNFPGLSKRSSLPEAETPPKHVGLVSNNSPKVSQDEYFTLDRLNSVKTIEELYYMNDNHQETSRPQSMVQQMDLLNFQLTNQARK